MPSWLLIVCIVAVITTVICIAFAHARKKRDRHENFP